MRYSIFFFNNFMQSRFRALMHTDNYWKRDLTCTSLLRLLVFELHRSAPDGTRPIHLQPGEFEKCVKYSRCFEWADKVMIIDTRNKICDQGSNSILICCIPFCTNTIEKSTFILQLRVKNLSKLDQTKQMTTMNLKKNVNMATESQYIFQEYMEILRY